MFRGLAITMVINHLRIGIDPPSIHIIYLMFLFYIEIGDCSNRFQYLAAAWYRKAHLDKIPWRFSWMLCFADDVPAYPDVSRVSIHIL